MLRPIHSFRKSDPFKINQTKGRNDASCVQFFIYCHLYVLFLSPVPGVKESWSGRTGVAVLPRGDIGGP